MSASEILAAVLQFISSWWGLLFVVIALVLMFIFQRQQLKRLAIRLIFLAEERARQYALKTGKEKFSWVVEHGYQYVPVWLKLFITKAAFAAIVQAAFDSIVDWAERQELRPPQVE